MDNQIILRSQNLSIGYFSKDRQNTIASDINLSLKRGKLIALIGVNGVGKSTLLRTLTGIQKPISGQVFLDDKNIADYNPVEMAQSLSLVLTEKLPPSNLTVFELAALGRQPYTNWIGTLTTEDRFKIQQALELTQMVSLSNKKHYEISDGQLQKVLIARAIAQDTPLIILDEPTTHLDLLHKFSLLKLLKNLTVSTQKCILFSTHDIELALQVCDEVIVMEAGKIIHETPEVLIRDDHFDLLFPDENIIFDRERGKFIFKNF